jgi:hypothetical protein
MPAVLRRPIAAALFPFVLAAASAPDAGGAAALAPLPRGHAGRVDFAPDVEGSAWARAATYKAGFERGGASYVPFLGAHAPRNFPVTFRLEGVELSGSDVPFERGVAPRRTGDQGRIVAYDRGTLVERYETAPESVEQTFVFEHLESRGELALSISAETELRAQDTADGFEFRNDHGAVRYGRATAIDASGARCAAATTLEGVGIRIVVPASFVERARLPLTIDPVITTFFVDATTEDDFDPDVAYDATTNHYLAVYEEVFSASDHDVVATLLDAAGTVLDSSLVDSPLSEDWRKPRVANHDVANQFLVVAESGSAIDARTTGAAALSFGAVIPVAAIGNDPDVGGDPSTLPASYCVVYEQFLTEIGYAIKSVIVDTDGTLGLEQTLNFAGPGVPLGRSPSISKSNNNGDEWSVVWEQLTSGTNGDIFGCRIFHDGTISVPKFPIDTSASDDRHPAASTEMNSNDRWLAVWEREGINRNIVARFLDGSTGLDFVDLSSLEGNSPIADQYSASVDCDGRAFAIAYTEWVSFPSPDEDVCVATLTPVGDQLVLSEGHRVFSASTTVDEHAVQIASNEGSDGAPGRFIAVWGVATGGTQFGDIEGGLYDAQDFTSFCAPGQAGVLPCPCANPPSAVGRGCDNSSSTGGAILSQSGTASLATDTMVLTTSNERPTALSIVAQFTTLAPAGLQFGMGVRCASGTLKRLYSKTASSGSITAPQGGDLSVSARSAAVGDPLVAGTTRYYLVFYRDPNVLGGCAANLTFNATQTGAVTWWP